MRILVLGGSGQLGTEIRALTMPSGLELVAPPRAEIDISDAAAIERLVAAEPWTAVINAAGYTYVDRAEQEEALAFAVNTEAAGRLAAATGSRGIPFIHVSTDYVFDGRKGAPYVESDAPSPLNAYGRTKLAGEQKVTAANPRHVILRSAWLFSAHGNNFVRTILRLAVEHERLTVVADQVGCPTAAHDLARACLSVTLNCAADPSRAAYGIYHFASAETATWFDFAKAIVEQARGRLARLPDVVPTTTARYDSPTARPADSRLDCTAIGKAFGIAPPSWRPMLAATVQSLLA
jgi:dTDP-4-dehydrorhamnose reductase